MNSKETINVIWLKRNLRLQDNEAISNALDSGYRCLLLFVFEPKLLNDEHYSERHWSFIKQSLADINAQLQSYQSKVLCVESDIVAVCNLIQEHYRIENIYSHQETGIRITYDRDKAFKRYCKNLKII